MEKHLKTAEIFAILMDAQFTFFGIRFGINALIDLIPEIGDFIAAGLSLYLVWIAIKMGLPYRKILHMIFNILINLLIGLIPIIGDISYIVNKANMKNLKILQDFNKNVITGKVTT